MKKYKILKLISAILIAITLITSFSQVVSAVSVNIDKFNGKGDKGEATEKVKTIIGTTINAIQIIGTGIAIVMLAVMGIKFVGASPEGKAHMAETFRYYILGVIFIFAAVTLLEIIQSFTADDIVNEVDKVAKF